jgi:hypothetical protein
MWAVVCADNWTQSQLVVESLGLTRYGKPVAVTFGATLTRFV